MENGRERVVRFRVRQPDGTFTRVLDTRAAAQRARQPGGIIEWWNPHYYESVNSDPGAWVPVRGQAARIVKGRLVR